MLLYSLRTENFRLLAPQSVDFAPGVNVIAGANAQGKTTLLEAVYLLTGARGFRSRYDKELIAFDRDAALVWGAAEFGGRRQETELRLFRGKRRELRRNGVKRSAAELTENLNAVLFCPDDLQLVRGGAAERRRMMDMAISQLRPGYRAILSDYNRLYDNKTAILRDWRERPSLLEPLDEFNTALCRSGAKIIRYRASFVRRLSALAQSIHREFSGGSEDLRAEYTTVSSVSNAEGAEGEVFRELWRRQEELRQAELDAGLCLVGPHKDDLAIAINGSDARQYASQGQTRTAALSLKLAEREIFLQENGEPPLLLLDDVLSELDGMRQEFVLNRIGGGQTLITCCDESAVGSLQGGKVLHLKGGRVE